MNSALAENFGGGDRHAPHAPFRASKGGDDVLAFLGLERAGAIDQRAAGLGQRDGAVDQPALQRGKRRRCPRRA